MLEIYNFSLNTIILLVLRNNILKLLVASMFIIERYFFCLLVTYKITINCYIINSWTPCTQTTMPISDVMTNRILWEHLSWYCPTVYLLTVLTIGYKTLIVFANRIINFINMHYNYLKDVLRILIQFYFWYYKYSY